MCGDLSVACKQGFAESLPPPLTWEPSWRGWSEWRCSINCLCVLFPVSHSFWERGPQARGFFSEFRPVARPGFCFLWHKFLRIHCASKKKLHNVETCFSWPGPSLVPLPVLQLLFQLEQSSRLHAEWGEKPGIILCVCVCEKNPKYSITIKHSVSKKLQSPLMKNIFSSTFGRC